jgi:hypothetical protein
MTHTIRNRLLCAGLALGLWAGAAAADTPKPDAPKPEEPQEACNYLLHHTDPDHTFHRAGYANQVSKWAKPSINCRFDGAYVGGGGVCLGRGGEPRYPHEGVWGWDYVGGCPFYHRVFLCWNHGRKYQGGPGQYDQTGPEFPPEPHLPQLVKKKKCACED